MKEIELPSDWSEVFIFSTIRSGPGLVYPPDNEINISVHINFSWNSISGAVNYQLHISSDNQFTTPEFNIDNINDTKYEETGLSHSQQYYWRVRAHFDDGSSAWSEVRRFTTYRWVLRLAVQKMERVALVVMLLSIGTVFQQQ